MTNQRDNQLRQKANGLRISPKSSSWNQLRNQLDSHKRKQQRTKMIYLISSVAACVFFAAIFLVESTESSSDSFALENSASFTIENLSTETSDVEYEQALYAWIDGADKINYNRPESKNITL